MYKSCHLHTAAINRHFTNILATSIFLLNFGLKVNAFGPSTQLLIPSLTQKVSSSLKMSSNDNISGSFFNPIPDRDDNNENDDNSNKKGEEQLNASTENVDPFDLSMVELIRQRNQKPLASNPSTVGGVPTSKAKGFGKSTSQGPQLINTTSGKKSFIGIGKPLNDINNPEYDDQGYTLYADEETGEKQRVFEALIEYPCEFKLKIIGLNEGTFAEEMVQVVADSCNVQSDNVKFTERQNGKWTSVTVFAPVENAEMLYTLYENVDRDPRVKFKF